MSKKEKYPVVAIVGRANVGKSTLFNRFIGRRKAITDPTPGVTRDVVTELYEPEGEGGPVLKLMDTGGVNSAREGLDRLVTDKSMAALKEADIVLLLLEIKGLTGEDELFIEKIRRFSDKVILVINKVDTPEKEHEIWNYHSLGFKHVVPISSAHGYNIGLLDDVILDELELLGFSRRASVLDETDNSLDEFLDKDDSNLDETASEEYEESSEPKEKIINLAILGKPNTGKSTLSNLLTESSSSLVSDIPGTTRDIVEGVFSYKDVKFNVMDTAGIRRKSRVHENVEYYSVTRAIKSIENSDLVFLVIDGEEGLSEQDKKIAGHVVKKGKGIIVVLNKCDKFEKIANAAAAMEDRIRFFFPVLDFAPVAPISALKEVGIEALLKAALKVNRQLETRVSTSSLNKALKDWLEEFAPPTDGRIRYKIRYMTQVGIKPTRFLIFVNRIKGFPENYLSYLKNKIKKSFGLNSIPIIIDIKETEKIWKEE